MINNLGILSLKIYALYSVYSTSVQHTVQYCVGRLAQPNLAQYKVNQTQQNSVNQWISRTFALT
jgi:hypothetical protein